VGKNSSKREILKWHPAFSQAVRRELEDYRDSLKFTEEYELISGPQRIDLLIIKKPKGLIIDKNIARIFRTNNLLEYKSPEDYLSVKDFLKVYGYANNYAAIIPKVNFAEVTLTFIENRHPRELLKYLTKVRGYGITEKAAGIYEVTGDYVPIQIIESGKLSEDDNLWLKSLVNDLKFEKAMVIVEEMQKPGQETPMNAYFEVIVKANPEVFSEVQKMVGDATFEEVFTKAGIIPKWLERGRKQGLDEGLEQGREQGLERAARNALVEGASPEFVQKITGLDLETINRLASKAVN
jgi:hypothetical protein